MKKIYLIVVLLGAVALAVGCGGGGGGGTSETPVEEGEGELEGGGGTGGTVNPESDPLTEFSLSNVPLDPESLLVTNSTGTVGSISARVADKQTAAPAGPGMEGGTDFSMVGYIQEAIQDETSWHANKFEAEFRLFDWGLNQAILPLVEEGVYKYAYITWPSPTEAGVEGMAVFGGEFLDIFNDTMERYYRYTMTSEGTWQVDICGDDQQKFIEYDRLIDAATNTISSSATLIKGHVVDMWDVGGTSAAGGADMTDDIAGLGLEAGQNQTAMIFKSKLVDQRTLKAGAAGEIEFSEIDSGSQASYFDDNYGQGVAEISLDNTDPTNPINTVRGYMLATFGTDSNWGSGIKAVNGLGTAYTYEGSGEATMSGTEPAMDISWSCSNLEGNACWEMGMMNDWETIMAACDDFWMSYDGTCEGTDYQTCLGLIPTVDSTCSFTESFPESYYMEDDSYGYPGFFKTDAVSNSAISDALTGLTALTADNLADISFTRTWDCTATAWDAESDQSTATLPSEVMGEFAVGYGLQSHNDPTEATQGEMIEDMCEGCEYTGETECFDPSCYCSDPANAANPECGYGGDAYCQTNPEACGGDEGFFDNCMMYPDSPECAGMEPPSCEETCASAPPEFYDSCMESCEGMLM